MSAIRLGLTALFARNRPPVDGPRAAPRWHRQGEPGLQRATSLRSFDSSGSTITRPWLTRRATRLTPEVLAGLGRHLQWLRDAGAAVEGAHETASVSGRGVRFRGSNNQLIAGTMVELAQPFSGRYTLTA